MKTATRHRVVSVLCLALALCACAPPQKLEEEARPVWPAEPAKPRIAFLRAFSRPDDLGITKGFFTHLMDLLLGASDARLVRPMAVLEDRGVIYVADTGVMGVHRFDTTQGDYRLVRASGDTPLVSPVALARGAAGEVYVSDSARARVFVIRPGAKLAEPLPLQVALGQPTGLAYDTAGRRLFVLDTKAHEVKIFDRDGALESTIGRRGNGNGEFNFPTHLWRTAAGRLYVTDALNFRVQVFDENGRFVTKFGRVGDAAGDMPRQKGVALDQYGHIYVVDAVLHAIQIFDESGALLLSLGRLGNDRGEFRLPTGIFIGGDDTIYVADSYNQRVQVLRYIGGPT